MAMGYRDMIINLEMKLSDKLKVTTRYYGLFKKLLFAEDKVQILTLHVLIRFELDLRITKKWKRRAPIWSYAYFWCSINNC